MVEVLRPRCLQAPPEQPAGWPDLRQMHAIHPPPIRSLTGRRFSLRTAGPQCRTGRPTREAAASVHQRAPRRRTWSGATDTRTPRSRGRVRVEAVPRRARVSGCCQDQRGGAGGAPSVSAAAPPSWLPGEAPAEPGVTFRGRVFSRSSSLLLSQPASTAPPSSRAARQRLVPRMVCSFIVRHPSDLSAAVVRSRRGPRAAIHGLTRRSVNTACRECSVRSAGMSVGVRPAGHAHPAGDGVGGRCRRPAVR